MAMVEASHSYVGHCPNSKKIILGEANFILPITWDAIAKWVQSHRKIGDNEENNISLWFWDDKIDNMRQLDITPEEVYKMVGIENFVKPHTFPAWE